eukprot:scaffold204356_cov45-Prasinocladus_malaysianus.AAC.1
MVQHMPVIDRFTEVPEGNRLTHNARMSEQGQAWSPNETAGERKHTFSGRKKENMVTRELSMSRGSQTQRKIYPIAQREAATSTCPG